MRSASLTSSLITALLQAHRFLMFPQCARQASNLRAFALPVPSHWNNFLDLHMAHFLLSYRPLFICHFVSEASLSKNCKPSPPIAPALIFPITYHHLKCFFIYVVYHYPQHRVQHLVCSKHSVNLYWMHACIPPCSKSKNEHLWRAVSDPAQRLAQLCISPSKGPSKGNTIVICEVEETEAQRGKVACPGPRVS